MSYADALDAALCYGWIDGQKKTFDDATWLQKFTPRGKRSIWSKINRDKAQRLVESGRMQSPGLGAVDRAKANGQWDSAYNSHRIAGVPDDLQRALEAHPKAKAFFATDGEKSRDAREENRAVRRDVGAARGDPFVARARVARCGTAGLAYRRAQDFCQEAEHV